MGVDPSGTGTTMPCPKCANDPLTTTGDQGDTVAELTELIGRECTECGYVIIDSDIDVAVIAALERLRLRAAKLSRR